MIQKKILSLLAIICLTTSAFAVNNYISDELYTYTHKGPGTKYRILGLVNAGEKIEVLSIDKNLGYTQIKDKKGRGVWVDSKYVTNKPGLKEELKALRIAEEKAKQKIIDLEKNLNSNIKQVAKLEKTNISLSSQLKEIKEINNSLTNRVDSEKNELLMQWFSYGGMVGGIGLLVGLILPALFPSRKKKSSW